MTFSVPNFVDRDIEAIAILSQSALPIACNRAHTRHYRRSLADRTGTIRLTPRIWTQLDVIEYNARGNSRELRHPSRRTSRLVSRLREDASELFPKVIEEARTDGMLSVLGTEYRDCNRLLNDVLTEAVSLSSSRYQNDRMRTERQRTWTEKLREIDQFTIGWMDYLKRAKPNQEATNGSASQSQSIPPNIQNVDEPMRRAPYTPAGALAEDKWIFENIHSNKYEDLRVEHADRYQSGNKTKSGLSRNQFKTRADRYGDYHGLRDRRFKGYCNCDDCKGVSDT